MWFSYTLLILMAILLVLFWVRLVNVVELSENAAKDLADDLRPLAPHERYEAIIKLLQTTYKEWPVTRTRLALELNTTESTIKKDVAHLLKIGRLKFVRQVGSQGAVYKAYSQVSVNKKGI